MFRRKSTRNWIRFSVMMFCFLVKLGLLLLNIMTLLDLHIIERCCMFAARSEDLDYFAPLQLFIGLITFRVEVVLI